MTAFIDALADYRRRHPDEAATVAEFAELAGRGRRIPIAASGAGCTFHRFRVAGQRRWPARASPTTASSIAGCSGRARRRRPRPGSARPARGGEESGRRDLVVEGGLFDLDRHWILERGAEPGHWHYDVRFVVRATGSEEFVVGEESHDLAWRDIEAIANDPASDESLRRMAGKWLALNSLP